jgi:hypothetical protein
VCDDLGAGAEGRSQIGHQPLPFLITERPWQSNDSADLDGEAPGRATHGRTARLQCRGGTGYCRSIQTDLLPDTLQLGQRETVRIRPRRRIRQPSARREAEDLADFFALITPFAHS